MIRRCYRFSASALWLGSITRQWCRYLICHAVDGQYHYYVNIDMAIPYWCQAIRLYMPMASALGLLARMLRRVAFMSIISSRWQKIMSEHIASLRHLVKQNFPAAASHLIARNAIFNVIETLWKADFDYTSNALFSLLWIAITACLAILYLSRTFQIMTISLYSHTKYVEALILSHHIFISFCIAISYGWKCSTLRSYSALKRNCRIMPW